MSTCKMCLECTHRSEGCIKDESEVRPGIRPCRRYELDAACLSEEPVLGGFGYDAGRKIDTLAGPPDVPIQEPPPTGKKAEAFIRICDKRLPKALKAIGLLENLGSYNYEHNSDQARNIVEQLQYAVDDVKEALG